MNVCKWRIKERETKQNIVEIITIKEEIKQQICHRGGCVVVERSNRNAVPPLSYVKYLNLERFGFLVPEQRIVTWLFTWPYFEIRAEFI